MYWLELLTYFPGHSQMLAESKVCSEPAFSNQKQE